MISEKSRVAGWLYILLCDPDDRLVQPIAVDELDGTAPKSDRVKMLRVFLDAAEHAGGSGSILLAIARHHGLSVTADDVLWAESAVAALGDWRLLGVHVVTSKGSRPVPGQASAA